MGAVLGVFLIWLQVSPSDDASGVRVAATDGALSAQIVDGETRILILNASGPQDGRSVLGKLNRPWEARPATVIVGADRQNIVEALWEVVQRLEPGQIIVVGAPGADTDWALLERYCRDHDIDLRFLDSETILDGPTVAVKIVPPLEDASSGTGSYVEISRGNMSIGVELGSAPSGSRYHLIVADGAVPDAVWRDLQVTTNREDNPAGIHAILLDPGDRIDIRIQDDALAIRGKAAKRRSRT